MKRTDTDYHVTPDIPGPLKLPPEPGKPPAVTKYPLSLPVNGWSGLLHLRIPPLMLSMYLIRGGILILGGILIFSVPQKISGAFGADDTF